MSFLQVSALRITPEKTNKQTKHQLVVEKKAAG